MIERKITVASEHGLHARPAAIFVQAATEAGVPVTIAKGDKSVNAASILGVLSLGVSKETRSPFPLMATKLSPTSSWRSWRPTTTLEPLRALTAARPILEIRERSH